MTLHNPVESLVALPYLPTAALVVLSQKKNHYTSLSRLCVLPDQLRKDKVRLGALASLVPSLVQSCSHWRYVEHFWDKHEQNTTFLTRILVGSGKGADYGIVGLFVHKHFFHTVSTLQRYQSPVPDTTSPACHTLPYPRRYRTLPPACTSPSVEPQRRDYYHHRKPTGRPLPRTFPRPPQLWARAAYRVPKLQPFSQKSRTPTVPKQFQIGLCGVVEADLELFGNSCSAGVSRERLYQSTPSHS